MNSKKGFSLTELLVVVAIIILLVTIVLGALGGNRAKARDAKRLDDMRTFQAALEFYYNKYRSYPCGDSDDNIVHYVAAPPGGLGTVDGTASCGAGGPTDHGFLNGNGGGIATRCAPTAKLATTQNVGLFTESLLPSACIQDPKQTPAGSNPNYSYIYQVSADRQSYLLSTYLESNKAAMIDDGGLCADAYEVGSLLGVARPRYPGDPNTCVANPSF